MRKIMILLFALTLISISGYNQEVKAPNIIGTWEIVDKVKNENMFYTFRKDMKYIMGSSNGELKHIDTGFYVFEKFGKNFNLTTIHKISNIEIKMNFLITFTSIDTLRLEIANPDEHEEYSELASELSVLFVRKKS